MRAWNGHFDAKRNPCITLQVAGTRGNPQDVVAVVDTGFSGFLLMPIFGAFPLGLALLGTTTANLADGSKSATLAAYATVGFAGRSAEGVAILPQEAAFPLVGLDFLRKFHLALVITSSQIVLMDERDYLEIAEAHQGPPIPVGI